MDHCCTISLRCSNHMPQRHATTCTLIHCHCPKQASKEYFTSGFKESHSCVNCFTSQIKIHSNELSPFSTLKVSKIEVEHETKFPRGSTFHTKHIPCACTTMIMWYSPHIHIQLLKILYPSSLVYSTFICYVLIPQPRNRWNVSEH